MKSFTLAAILSSYLVASASPAPQPQVEISSLRIGLIRDNTATAGTADRQCFVLHENGSWHMEDRHQQKTDRTNKVVVYESKISDQQLKTLQGIIRTARLAELPTYVPPTYPLTISSFELFEITLTTGSNEYRRGYLYTPGVNNPSVQSTPDDVRNSWLASREALAPFSVWLDNLGWKKMKPSLVKPTTCAS